MCYHKSFAKKLEDLFEHYSASFQSITEDLEIVKERFTILLQKDESLGSLGLGRPDDLYHQLVACSQKDALPTCYTKEP